MSFLYSEMLSVHYCFFDKDWSYRAITAIGIGNDRGYFLNNNHEMVKISAPSCFKFTFNGEEYTLNMMPYKIHKGWACVDIKERWIMAGRTLFKGWEHAIWRLHEKLKDDWGHEIKDFWGVDTDEWEGNPSFTDGDVTTFSPAVTNNQNKEQIDLTFYQNVEVLKYREESGWDIKWSQKNLCGIFESDDGSKERTVGNPIFAINGTKTHVDDYIIQTKYMIYHNLYGCRIEQNTRVDSGDGYYIFKRDEKITTQSEIKAEYFIPNPDQKAEEKFIHDSKNDKVYLFSGYGMPRNTDNAFGVIERPTVYLMDGLLWN